jgi:hypothetical protein
MEKDEPTSADLTADIAAEATIESSPAQTAPETLPPPARDSRDAVDKRKERKRRDE